jgi:hypothetical protein
VGVGLRVLLQTHFSEPGFVFRCEGPQTILRTNIEAIQCLGFLLEDTSGLVVSESIDVSMAGIVGVTLFWDNLDVRIWQKRNWKLPKDYGFTRYAAIVSLDVLT